MHAGQRAPLCEVFKPRQIETWERLVNKVWTSKGIAAAGDPKALLDAELDSVWPLCAGNHALLQAAAIAALAEISRAAPKKPSSGALINFFRSVVRTQIGKIKQSTSQTPQAPVRKRRVSRWGS